MLDNFPVKLQSRACNIHPFMIQWMQVASNQSSREPTKIIRLFADRSLRCDSWTMKKKKSFFLNTSENPPIKSTGEMLAFAGHLRKCTQDIQLSTTGVMNL